MSIWALGLITIGIGWLVSPLFRCRHWRRCEYGKMYMERRQGQLGN